jgi:hypothetical protein
MWGAVGRPAMQVPPSRNRRRLEGLITGHCVTTGVSQGRCQSRQTITHARMISRRLRSAADGNGTTRALRGYQGCSFETSKLKRGSFLSARGVQPMHDAFGSTKDNSCASADAHTPVRSGRGKANISCVPRGGTREALLCNSFRTFPPQGCAPRF